MSTATSTAREQSRLSQQGAGSRALCRDTVSFVAACLPPRLMGARGAMQHRGGTTARCKHGIACSTASVLRETDKRHGSPCRQAQQVPPAICTVPWDHEPPRSHRGHPRAFCALFRPVGLCRGAEARAALPAASHPAALPCRSRSSCHRWKPLRDTWWLLPSPQACSVHRSQPRAHFPCVQGLPEGLEQPCPGPTPPGFKTHQFPLPFPPNQPAESFINLRKRESKQKEPKAEPKRDLSNLPSLSSLGPRYYLSAFAESPPSGDAPGPSGGAGPRHSPRSSNDCVISAISSSASLRRRRGDALPGLAVPGEQRPGPRLCGPLEGQIRPADLWGLGPCPIQGCGTGLSPCSVGQRQG